MSAKPAKPKPNSERQSEDSVDAVAKAVARFEAEPQHLDFKAG